MAGAIFSFAMKTVRLGNCLLQLPRQKVKLRKEQSRRAGSSGLRFSALGALWPLQVHAVRAEKRGIGLRLWPERIIRKTLIQRGIQKLACRSVKAGIRQDGHVGPGEQLSIVALSTTEALL